jgi:hypothetical protein
MMVKVFEEIPESRVQATLKDRKTDTSEECVR